MKNLQSKMAKVAMLLAVFAIFAAGASQVGKTKYKSLRSVVDANDPSMTGTTKTFAYYKANLTEGLGYSVKVPQNVAVQFVWTFKNANADTASFEIYGYKDNGPAEFVASGALLSGAQISDGSRYYADTITSQVERWTGAADWIDADGNDGVAKLVIDGCDYTYFVCVFTAVSATDNVSCDVTWYDVNGD